MIGPKGVPAQADVDDFVRIISPFVYVLDHPVYVYNWHPASSDSELSTNSQDPKSYKNLKDMANRYWGHQTASGNTSDMFGTGLYAAVDPVSTFSYGGGGDSWVLTQMKLPSGFKMLDLARDVGFVLPLDQSGIITKLGCPESWKYQPLLMNMMNPSAYAGYPKCAAAIREIFKDKIKIDGFSYGYESTRYKECDSQDANLQSAFVIVRDDKIPASSVRIFDRITQDDQSDRLRIQSLFAKATEEGLYQSPSSSYSSSTSNSSPTPAQIAAFLKASPKMAQYSSWADNQLGMSGYSSGNNQMAWQITLCNRAVSVNYNAMATASVSAPLQCVEVTMPASALNGTTPVDLTQGALWADIKDKPVDKDINTWIRGNIYACQKTPPYIQLSSLEKKEQVASCAKAEAIDSTVPNLSQALQGIVGAVN